MTNIKLTGKYKPTGTITLPRNLAADVELLRDALVRIVGSDDKAELEEMAQRLSSISGILPHEDQAAMLNAIQVLLGIPGEKRSTEGLITCPGCGAEAVRDDSITRGVEGAVRCTYCTFAACITDWERRVK